jgi:hypothetical protein
MLRSKNANGHEQSLMRNMELLEELAAYKGKLSKAICILYERKPRITFDSRPAEEAVNALRTLCDSEIPRDLSGEINELLNAPEKLFVIERERTAASGTSDVVMCFYPSDRLQKLLTADRATNIDRGVVRYARHLWALAFGAVHRVAIGRSRARS